MHLVWHPEEQVGYVGVLDSASFTKFGNQQMSKPSDRSRLVSREFIEIKPNVVKERKEMLGEKVHTLNGIKSKYEYVCCPNGKVRAVYPVLLDVSYLGYVEALSMLLPSLSQYDMV